MVGWIIITATVFSVGFSAWLSITKPPWADWAILRLTWMATGIAIVGILVGLLMLCMPSSKSYSTVDALWISGAGAFILLLTWISTWYDAKAQNDEAKVLGFHREEEQVLKHNSEGLSKLGYTAYIWVALKPGNDGTIISESSQYLTILSDKDLDKLEEMLSQELQSVREYRCRSLLSDSVKCGVGEGSHE